MQQSYWIKQGKEAFFADMAWARPETKRTAGKLLVVGGHGQSFAAPAKAHRAAEQAGIGSVQTLLPDSLEKALSKTFPETSFAPSHASGGFVGRALAEFTHGATWADGVLLAGDFGRNSESLAMLEKFAAKYNGQLSITQDAADFFCTQPQTLQERPETLLVLDLAQLQKLGRSLRLPYAFTSNLGIRELVAQLHELTVSHQNLFIITQQQNNYAVAVAGKVCTSPAAEKTDWQISHAASAATWWLQNPKKPFEAFATCLVASM
ncbi:hypothetical protein CSA80_02055 [Candidatus Saccharibacteria bacterium]|nr:MAG: hypothetical protein CSA80_02055 [Candidatus Saccharibacteria bacterium]